MKILSSRSKDHPDNVFAQCAPVTFSEVGKLWLDEVALLVELEQLSEATGRAYRYTVDLLADPVPIGGDGCVRLGDLALGQLDQRLVWAWYKTLRERHGVATAYWSVQRLRALIAFARRSGLMQGDPTAGLRPRRCTRPVRALTAEELRRLVAQVAATYAEVLAAEEARGLQGRALAAQLSQLAAILVIAGTGARVTEVCAAFCWQFEGNRLYLPKTKTRRERRVGIAGNCQRILARQVSLIGDARARMFPGPRSSHVSQSTVWNKLQGQAQKAGVGPISTHGLRHTFARVNINAGTDPAMLSWQLGHVDIEELKTYTAGALPPGAARSAQVAEEIAGGGVPWICE